MNTEGNMKRRRSLFGPIALSLVVWVIGGLALIGMPARAATPAQTATTTQTSTTTQTAPTAQAATTDSSLSIPVSGSTVATDGTKITFSGTVTVNSSAVMDVVGIPPFVIVTFDCSNVIATSGTGAKKVTYDTRGYQVTKIRELKATDVIVMTAPLDQLGAALTSANPWQVTATLNFNVTTGQLTSGTLAASNNATTTNSTTGTVETIP